MSNGGSSGNGQRMPPPSSNTTRPPGNWPLRGQRHPLGLMQYYHPYQRPPHFRPRIPRQRFGVRLMNRHHVVPIVIFRNGVPLPPIRGRPYRPYIRPPARPHFNPNIYPMQGYGGNVPLVNHIHNGPINEPNIILPPPPPPPPIPEDQEAILPDPIQPEQAEANDPPVPEELAHNLDWQINGH
ncbi:uncharacterized protein [Rhodnius prolixus]|uniref:uncharacterized protein n=1 Tax=Rhodnius prolixus TaxID=13249 RepID=UPI003D1893AF